MSIYKKRLKKFALGGIGSQIGQTAESLSPLTYKAYNQDYLGESDEMNKRNQNDITTNQLQGKAENLAMSLGPVGMATGLAIKGSRLLSNTITKGTTDQFGVVNSTGQGIIKGFGDAINPIGTFSHGIQNIGNDKLNTGEKILSFLPGASTIINNKVAKQEKEKYIGGLGKKFSAQGENNYSQALASGFNPYGTEKENYEFGGIVKGIPMMNNGGSLNNLSSDSQEVVGPSHEEGGVKFPNKGVELEGGETLNKDFVFSEELGFAKRHKSIAKAIGKIEKRDTPNNRFDKNSINRLKEREEELKIEQEQTKQQLGIPSDLDMKKFGGSLKNYGEGGGLPKNTSSIYKKISKVTNNDGRPGTSIYTPELAQTNDSRYGNTSKERQVQSQKEKEGSNDPFQIALREAQNNKLDTFNYKGLPYKSGTTTLTPAIFPTTNEIQQHRIITQKRDVQNIDSGTKQQREAKVAELKSKGYQNIGGSYNYEIPEKSEFMDATKVEDYFKSNPNAYYADPQLHMDYAKKQSTFKMGGSINKKLKKYDGGGNIQDYKSWIGGAGNKSFVNPMTYEDNYTTQGSTVQDNTNINNSNTKLNIPNVSGYADNITNFILNRQRAKQQVPNQELTKNLTPVNYDLSSQKIEADRQRIGFNKGIEQNTDNSGVANTNKAMGLAQTIRAKNEINMNELNMNNQEKARVQSINSGIQTNNNSITLNNKLRKLEAVDDIRREDSQNMANVVGKQQLSIRDNKQQQLSNDQNSLNLGAQDPKTVSILMRSNPEVFKRQGWTDKQIQDFLNGSTKRKMGGSLYKKIAA